MKSERIITAITLTILSCTFFNSCEKDTTYQFINVENELNQTINRIEIHSGDRTISFSEVMPDSSSTSISTRNLQTELEFTMNAGGKSRTIMWEATDLPKNITNGGLFVDGDFTFLISGTSIDNAIILLSSYTTSP